MLSGGGSQSRVVRDKQEPHVELQDMGGGPWGIWSVEVGLQLWDKAGGRTRLHLIHRVMSHPGCLGLRGFPGRGAFGAKAGKVLGNQYESVTPPVTGGSS